MTTNRRKRSRSDGESLGSLALELEKAVELHLRGEAAAAARRINDVAQKLGIVGGAFGVADTSVGAFRLVRSLPSWGSEGDSGRALLFPYRVEPANDISRSPSLEKPAAEAASEWLHRVFVLQRSRQTLGAANARGLEVPEFYGSLRSLVGNRPEPNAAEKRFLAVPWFEIRARILEWLFYWLAAFTEHAGFDTIGVPRGFTLTAEQQDLSLMTVLSTAVERTPRKIVLYKDLVERSPEAVFFFQRGLESAEERETARQITALAERVKVGELLRRLEARADIFHNRPHRSSGTFTRYGLLQNLHRRTLFPLLPYVVLAMVGSGPVHHCAIPLVDSRDFPVRATDARGNTFVHSCVLLFLGTIKHLRDESGPSHARLAGIGALVRRIAEPIAEKVYYGGIVKSGISRSVYTNLTHELSYLQAALTSRWLLDPSVCFDSSASMKSSSERFGALTFYEDGQGALPDVRVVTVPELFRAAGDRFALWTDRAWLQREAVGLHSSMLFKYALEILFTIAAQAAVLSEEINDTSTAVGAADSLASRDGAALVSTRFRSKVAARCRNLEAGLCVDPEETIWCGAPIQTSGAKSQESKRIIDFCRILIALCGNTLKHCREGAIITRVSFAPVTMQLHVLQENPCGSKGKSKSDGTVEVLRFLLSELGGDPDNLVFGGDRNDRFTVAFAVPADGLATTGEERGE